MQRLQRQATRLNTHMALLQHHSPFWSALTAVAPWDHARTVTYALRQKGHGIARVGFLQVQRRLNRPEADLLVLAPALDTRTGHPAIWQKLLAHYLNEAPHQQTQRIYADVPDQPLLENTLAHVGFRTYTRQSVWRLAAGARQGLPQALPALTRAQLQGDEWALIRLYGRTTPQQVQVAEGATGDSPCRPPILDWPHGGEWFGIVPAVDSDELAAYVRVVLGAAGVWMEGWAELGHSGDDCWRRLVPAALAAIAQQRPRLPIYMAVKEYQGGLNSVLDELGFAPFADHARMVRHTVQRVPAAESVRMPVLEALPEGLGTFSTLTPPDLLHRRTRRSPEHLR